MLLDVLFVVLMIVVFGKLIALCLRATWGIAKICFRLVFLPIVLIILAVVGLIWIAIPILLVIGILSWFVH